MLKFIINLAISVWTTSTLFMLFFWANAFITTWKQDGKIFLMPFGRFIYLHFCPIIHTRQCFQIMRRVVELKNAKERGV